MCVLLLLPERHLHLLLRVTVSFLLSSGGLPPTVMNLLSVLIASPLIIGQRCKIFLPHLPIKWRDVPKDGSDILEKDMR